MNRLFSVAILCLVMLNALPAAARNLPDYYPGSYEMIGSLTGINSHDHYIVILDFALPLDPAAKVYTPTTRFESLNYLRPGMLIGVSRAQKNKPVTEIWVLPDGFTNE